MHKINFKHVKTVEAGMVYPIINIDRDNFEEYRKVMVSAGHEPFKKITYSEVAIQIMPGTLIGAEWDGKIVGVCGAYTPPKGVIEAKAAGLYGLSVMPEYRKHGIGSYLISEMVLRLNSIGYPNIYVAVHESRQDAIRLYKSMGFVEVPEPVKRYDVINWLIKKYGYKKYLEIGVRKPEKCFDKIECKVKAGVDPAPRGKCKYIMTSDEFFKRNEDMYDIIFVDGLHLEEQAKRDVENSLSILKPNGTIVMHDCNPPTEFHQREVQCEGKWNGTVWKAYMHYRTKDYLKMCVIDDDWGLGIIHRGKQAPLMGIELTYSVLEANRKEWLNLMPFSQFKTWVDE